MSEEPGGPLSGSGVDVSPSPPNLGPESAQVRLIVMALSGVVFLLIAGVIYILPNEPQERGPSTLASLNDFLNASSGLCLIAGFILIRRKNVRLHRRAMLAACGLSSMFLLTYLMHHARVGSVPFQGSGTMRIVYFSLLIPHIVLSAFVVPMALLTIYRGWTNRIALHRKIARITLPIWLFVSFSGVLVYFMLYHL
jgi:uncharacterized membrane protein YozB (DUF420 family)